MIQKDKLIPYEFKYVLITPLFFILFCIIFNFNVLASSLKIEHPDSEWNVEEILKADLQLRKVTLLQEEGSEQFVLELQNSTVVNEGGIVTANGKVLKDTQTSLRGDQHRLLKKGRNLNNENPLFFKGKLAVISSPGSENWYHWLLQILPRLMILKESKVEYDRIYINNLQYPWQKESLQFIIKYLNIPEDKLLVVNGDCVIQAEILIVPSVPFIPVKNDILPLWMKTFLNTVFLNKEIDTKIHFPDKFYISRKKANLRRIKNEDELISYLKDKGFQIISLEELSPTTQAMLFNTAKVIIGPHGSGFSNLIFTKPGTKVIEIDHGTQEPRSYFKKMSEIMGARYIAFYVDSVTEDHLEDDMVVDLNKFKLFLENH